MRTAIRWLALAALVILVLMTGRVWAQEEEQAKTPQQVVSEFGDRVPLVTAHQREEDWDALMALVTQESQEALDCHDDELLLPILTWLALPRLVAEEVIVEGDMATVEVMPVRRSLRAILVKEEGQWKVDLLATLDKLPEPFRPDVESMRQQLAELESQGGDPLGPAAPQPQSGEQPPAADTGEAAQTGPVIEITLDNFKQEVLEAEIPVLVEFWTRDAAGLGWDDFRLAFDELARDYAGTVRFGSVDANRNIPLAIAYEVNRIPCLVLFRSGEELVRTIGYMNKQELQDWIEQNLAAQD